MARYKILVIDDEIVLRETMCTYLVQKGHEAISAAGCEEGDRLMRLAQPDAVLLDYTLADGNATELLTRWKDLTPQIPVIILTGHGSIDLAVQTVKLGADHFLTKPTDLSSLLVMVERAISNARARKCQLAEKTRQQRDRVSPFVGTSAPIRELAELASRIAPSDSSILIEGETGTGKGVLARWFHDNSARSDEPYMDLNCAGLSPALVDAELFGYERGAFTGAVQPKPGLFEIAHRGTVFLDEIGDVDIQVQPKLLKVLEEKQMRRLGDVKSRRIDIRLISATHHDLNQAIAEKTFRSDLYFRINTFIVSLPPLSRRIEDIPALADWFLQSFAKEFRGRQCDIAPPAMRELQRYHWPGNIRELKNVLERATVLSENGHITEKELQFRAVPATEVHLAPEVKTIEELERTHIKTILVQEHGRVSSAAVKLGMPRSSLYQKLKYYGIDRQGADTRP